MKVDYQMAVFLSVDSSGQSGEYLQLKFGYCSHTTVPRGVLA